jgi:hypothetical protein
MPAATPPSRLHGRMSERVTGLCWCCCFSSKGAEQEDQREEPDRPVHLQLTLWTGRCGQETRTGAERPAETPCAPAPMGRASVRAGIAPTAGSDRRASVSVGTRLAIAMPKSGRLVASRLHELSHGEPHTAGSSWGSARGYAAMRISIPRCAKTGLDPRRTRDPGSMTIGR